MVELLEMRQLLHAGGLGVADDSAVEHDGDGDAHVHQDNRRVFLESEAVSGSVTVSAATSSLTSIPVLNSLLGAAVSVFLDFDGHSESTWGAFSNIVQPAYDQDGDATTFSATELTAIQSIWQAVAEDYSPFNVKVTTVQPASFANGVSLRVSIGGDGSWYGPYGGVSYVDSFTNSISNIAFVFSKNLANGYSKYTSDAVSHESAHAFGLDHQSLYSGTTKVEEYFSGSGDGRAPIMGDSYTATRGLWWYGSSSASSSTYQDDMSVISRSANGFGYRVDDYGNTATTASALVLVGSQFTAEGVITTTSDVDYFSFSTDAGSVTINADVLANVNNLDARLQLFDLNGGLVASSDPSTSFGASLTADLAAGSYRVAVSSHGGYGDVGQYSVTGTVVTPTSAIETPGNLAAATQSTSAINLTWADNASNETGYRVYRSSDGVTWMIIATLDANSTSFTATSLSSGTSHWFVVSAFNATAVSDFSNLATATTLANAPANLTAAAVTSSRIDLAWSDVSGESGYKIERSTDGVNWTQIATTGANVTSYSNTGLNSVTTYSYRVRANNAGGDSATSNVASATTQSAQILPAAPTTLKASSPSANRVNLSWTDKSNNENGFQIVRSSDNGRTWVSLATVGAGTKTFADTSVTARKTYLYAVRAFNDAGYSAYTNTARVTTPRFSLALGAARQSGLAIGAATTLQSIALPVSANSYACPAAFERTLVSTSSGTADPTRRLILDRHEFSVQTETSATHAVEAMTSAGASPVHDHSHLIALFGLAVPLGDWHTEY